MSKHLKAEWFRVTHAGIYISMYIVFGLMTAVLPFVFSEKPGEMDLSIYISGGVETMMLMFAAFIGTLTGVMVGKAYHHRTYYYEIMNGSGIHKMIGSRLLVYNGMALVFAVVPMGIVCAVVVMRNGAGEIKNVALFAFLALLVIVRLVNRAVLFAMLVKNLIGGAVIPWFSAEIEQMAYMMAMEMNQGNSEQIQKIFDWFPTVQFMRLAQPEYAAGFVMVVIVSLFAESVLVYLAVYATYKRKMFK